MCVHLGLALITCSRARKNGQAESKSERDKNGAKHQQFSVSNLKLQQERTCGHGKRRNEEKRKAKKSRFYSARAKMKGESEKWMSEPKR